MINSFCKRPHWECTRDIVGMAQGRKPADLVIRGANLVNVHTAEIQPSCDIAVIDGRIAYLGQADHCVGEGTEVIDAQGLYAAPGLLDGHIHVESSMVGAAEYACAVIPHGTVGIYWDPHEICNVLGLEGVKVMMDDASRTPLKTMVTTPSCVPAVPGFEDTGASIDAGDIRETMGWDGVVGLGEMMDYGGVLSGADRSHDEIAETLKADRVVTGHYPALEADRGLNAYVGAGARCCHESTRAEDALAKARLGMYAQLRYGSAWLDLPNLAEAVTASGVDTRYFNIVSDDAHPHTLVEQGHLDRALRVAVGECGFDPIQAIQMVTINVATCFRMENELGSIAPGKCADIVLFEDLRDFRARMTIIDGEVVAKGGRALFDCAPYDYPDWVTHSVHVAGEITPASFAVPAPEGAGERVGVRTIEVIGGNTLTNETIVPMTVHDGLVESDLEQDVLKAFVFERHHATGKFGVGFVRGFGIKRGAMASTFAHDAHNLLVVGTNDDDMALAANTLVECGGGQVVVADGEVVALVELPIAGLMDSIMVEPMSAKVHELEHAWEKIGCTMPSPFMTMALIPLACIPRLRLTNRGLVNTDGPVDRMTGLFEQVS